MSQYVLDNVLARINTKYCYFAFSGNLSDAKFNNTRNYHLDRQLRMKEVKRDLRAIRYFVKTSRPKVSQVIEIRSFTSVMHNNRRDL